MGGTYEYPEEVVRARVDERDRLREVAEAARGYLRVMDETAGVVEARRVAQGYLREALVRLEEDC